MKKHKFFTLLALAALTLTSTKVWADDEPKQDSSYKDEPAAISVSDLEALSNRIKALESAKSSSLQVDGLFQFWYTHDSWGSPVASNGSYTSSKNQWDAFSVKRAEISATGSLGSDPKVSFKISLDPSLASFSGIGQTTNPATPLTYEGNFNPFSLVKDLYAQVAYSPYATIIVGQNKLWNELEGRTPSKDLDFNNYTNVGGTSFGNKRDLGVQVTGNGIPLDAVQFEYNVGVVSGAGQSTADNNVDKDLVGRVGATYDKSLYLGVSAYDGWEVNGVRQDIGFEGRWVSGGFKVQGEFITGSVNTADSSAINNSTWAVTAPAFQPNWLTPYAVSGQIAPTGYYLLANYRLDDWRLGARWDGYNANQQSGVSAAKGNQELDTITLGLDWYQAKDALKWSLNWEDHLVSGFEAYQILTVQSQLYI